MMQLIAGLILFMLPHSLTLFAPAQQQRWRASSGIAFMVAYALLSLAGLYLIVTGYAAARYEPTILWSPPVAMRHFATLLLLFAFILLVAAYVPGNAIKHRIGHPMLLSVKVWALSHLLVNGTLADVLLFGVFLLWAVALFVVLRRRDRLASAGSVATAARPSRGATLAAVIGGIVVWAVFALFLHQRLIGVAPFG